MFKLSKKGLNEQIRSQVEKLLEKCVIIGILTKTDDGLDKKQSRRNGGSGGIFIPEQLKEI